MAEQQMPHENNACGGKYSDWLEVMLLPECNAKCEWCCEKSGLRPDFKEAWGKMVDIMIARPEKTIMLLGGEPTLHPALGDIINKLKLAGKKVIVTTNGSNLTPEYVMKNLQFLDGLNISLHHYDGRLNEQITGLRLTDKLVESLNFLRPETEVRFNCNLINGYIDSMEEVIKYVDFAYSVGVGKVRFAELKGDTDKFVDATKIFPKIADIKEPYVQGCSHDLWIGDVAVNVRIMCGFQTGQRPVPINVCQKPTEVLYYDGKIYNGWQSEETIYLETGDAKRLMQAVGKGLVTSERAAELIEEFNSARYEQGKEDAVPSGMEVVHCRY